MERIYHKRSAVVFLVSGMPYPALGNLFLVFLCFSNCELIKVFDKNISRGAFNADGPILVG